MTLTQSNSHVIFIPHGGGPLPLLGDSGHEELINFLQNVKPTLGEPAAICVISAHWEAQTVTITSNPYPTLIYDYYGFPKHAYEIEYPALGNPALAKSIFDLLIQSGIEATLDSQRGFDHGLFVPLKLMFPDAQIPCVQLSLLGNLDAEKHIAIGKALRGLRQQNVLFIGSGFSFHNMRAFFTADDDFTDSKNEAFEEWLIDTCTNPHLSVIERDARLINWHKAPFAGYCHPREEHLLPLMVCYGLTDGPGQLVFDGKVLGKTTSAYLW